YLRLESSQTVVARQPTILTLMMRLERHEYHAKIICDEKFVHIPIDGETLIMRGAAPVARAPYKLAPSEMQELSNQLQELADKECTAFIDHKSLQHILDQKELNMMQHYWLELLSDYNYEIRYNPGKENIIADALSQKQRIKPLRVRALVMTLHPNLPSKILKAQNDAIKEENIDVENLQGMDKAFEVHPDGTRCIKNRRWLLLFGDLRDLIMHDSYKSNIPSTLVLKRCIMI
nr:putative reverse transcriptase domain-containing protein [Tanacetum cinerariifolium]